ncbi:DUF6286 domain-containing protein [Amycolatopsis sp. PS_44_ISF1]|uniref:DUF6286 domain-containing protein n=1 Tax=Amycolatopsis sp. PS_44_ISF1 TaxID=2974917 RepID=UPI0028DEA4FA|nr:DUF6286 domain-containing protein [Amycolatopsis sp. PS_44_ISF1]MDT8914059.1 DUF6286 domain-containing protein [Amycolatopsis sp. PS_44_ISF1]
MRVVVRLLSTLLALAVAAGGALLALEVGWHWWKPRSAPLLVPWPRWREHLAGLDWTATPVRVAAAVVLVAGLVLVALSLGAGRRAVRMTDPAEGVSVSTSPRSLARMVGLAVRAQDNVSGASVTAGARRIRVRASSRLEDEAQLRPRLLETVGTVLDGVPLAHRPKVTVVVDSPKDRR